MCELLCHAPGPRHPARAMSWRRASPSPFPTSQPLAVLHQVTEPRPSPPVRCIVNCKQTAGTIGSDGRCCTPAGRTTGSLWDPKEWFARITFYANPLEIAPAYAGWSATLKALMATNASWPIVIFASQALKSAVKNGPLRGESIDRRGKRGGNER